MNCHNILRNIHRIRTNLLIKYSTRVAANSNYIPIYKFPYIRPVSIINRLKLYQSCLTGISIPTSFILCNFGIISADTFVITFVMGITFTMSFFLIGAIPDKLIGFVYVKNDHRTAKISYIDFWGNRQDTEVPISDLVPLSDLPVVYTDPLFLTMRRFSSPETFKINLKYGIVLDKSKFNTVFLQKM